MSFKTGYSVHACNSDPVNTDSTADRYGDIQDVNTICDQLWEKVHFCANILNCVMHTVRTHVTLALRLRKPCVRSVFLSRVINESVVAPGYALVLETRIKVHAR